LNDNEQLTDYIGAFVDELSRADLEHVVISPGSRSTPMAILFAEHPNIKVWLNIDERSAGYFALGIAKATKKTVAVLCTSGTAAANYFPAIVEARESRVPLLVLTADRPHELRDVGAPQAIDQINIYGKYAKWFNEMALPESTPNMIAYVRTTAERAISTALSSPSGPVHLNFPFREPLIPNLDKQDLFTIGERNEKQYVKVHNGSQHLSDNVVTELAKELKEVKRGLIVCGPIDEPSLILPVLALANALNFPILADPLSQFRSGDHGKELIIDSYDAILKSEMVADTFAPDVIVRFGAMPVSKPYLLYLKKHTQCRQIVIENRDVWREPTLMADEIIFADPVLFAQALHHSLAHIEPNSEGSWTKDWVEMNRIVHHVIESNLSQPAINEGRVFTELEKILPQNAILFVGNSMPVRDLDTFFTSNVLHTRTMANRGANGIDGVVSTALGVSAVSEPVVLVIGDVSFYHDLNGLLAAKQYGLNITIILVNNDGGGIFSFLPQSKHPKHFEALFGTPLGIDFRNVVEMYKGTFKTVDAAVDFASAFKEAIVEDGLSVVEVLSNREQNVNDHRSFAEEVKESIMEYLLERS
jgi:2-succinyl-5-enolpyruvyl-6-hydroxy-3-cyclohexene-1-carboxylate synthase